MSAKKMADPQASQEQKLISGNVNTGPDLLARCLDAVKNARERLRVDVTTYKGKTYLDCRVWFVGEDGEYHPSGKGFMVRPEMAPELLRGIDLAARSFDPKGAA